jgi:hypothetical protein
MLARQIAGEGKVNRKNTTDNSKIQLMESNIGFLFEKLDSISEVRNSLSASKSRDNRMNESPSHHQESVWNAEFERGIHNLRSELKLEITDLTNSFCAL